MAYSHWTEPRPVQGSEQRDCMILCGSFHILAELEQGLRPIVPPMYLFPIPAPPCVPVPFSVNIPLDRCMGYETDLVEAESSLHDSNFSLYPPVLLVNTEPFLTVKIITSPCKTNKQTTQISKNKYDKYVFQKDAYQPLIDRIPVLCVGGGVKNGKPPVKMGDPLCEKMGEPPVKMGKPL